MIYDIIEIDVFNRKGTKHLPTEKKVVHTKTRTYIRNQHVNKNKQKSQHEYNKEYFDSISDLGFVGNRIKNVSKVTSGGITSGVSKFNVGDNSFYFKPSQGEKFFKNNGDNIRAGVKLYNKKTGEQITPDELKKIPENKQKNYRGWLSTREDLAYKISNRLGLKHIPPTATRKVKGKNGVVISDIYTHYKDKYEKIINIEEAIGLDKDNLQGLIKKDERIGDKAVFDYIIGNTDRHIGNFLVGRTKDGKYEMIGFDQGLSFPDNMKNYKKDLDANGNFLSKVGKLKVSKEFSDKLKMQKESPDFKEVMNEIKIRVGEKESKFFEQRYNEVLKKLHRK